MKFRNLGRSGLEISEIGFGAWAIGGSWGPQKDEESIDALHRALDLGVNFIDTAALYGDGRSERLIAKVLKERGELNRVIVATKTPPSPGPWPPSPYCRAEERFSEKHLRENVEERLRNLKTDCIDILQLHTWTRAWNRDPVPLEFLRTLQKEGKIRFFGISTPEHDQHSVVQLMKDGWIDTVQVIYNIFEQEPAAELLPVAGEKDVGIIVRVPFDESSLTGKLRDDTRFAEGDFRNVYFSGDRLSRAVRPCGNRIHTPPGLPEVCARPPCSRYGHSRYAKHLAGRGELRGIGYGRHARGSPVQTQGTQLAAGILVRTRLGVATCSLHTRSQTDRHTTRPWPIYRKRYRVSPYA